MQPFSSHTGIAVPMIEDDINTDQMAPVQAMREMKPDYKKMLFMRSRAEDPDFVLNKPQFSNPGILVTGNNFGAGSSREAAVWGMLANNIRVIVAKSFADIYRENCLQNGLLPVVLPSADADAFIARVVAVNGSAPFTVDLPTQTDQRAGRSRHRLRHSAVRPHAAARRPRRHRADAQAHRRDRRVREAHGGRNQPWLQEARDSRIMSAALVPATDDIRGWPGSKDDETWRKQNDRQKKLRAIMAGKKLVLMPGAYDALSARVIEAEGFEAIVAGGYAGVGSMLAQADMGQSNMRDYASHYGRICDAVEIPVYVDADTGFGGVNNVRQMVRAFEAAGVAGLFISDQVFPNRCGYLPGKQIVPVEQMLAKVKAALDARRDPDLFIAARTDAFGVEGPESAIARCQLFMEAGADMAKPMGFDTIPEIKRAMREIPGPHMATLSQAAGPKARSLPDLEAAGVCSATFPSIALFAAANAVRNVLRVLKRSDSLAPCQEHLIPLDDYYNLVGLKDLLAREESYDKAAAALVQKRAAE